MDIHRLSNWALTSNSIAKAFANATRAMSGLLVRFGNSCAQLLPASGGTLCVSPATPLIEFVIENLPAVRLARENNSFRCNAFTFK